MKILKLSLASLVVAVSVFASVDIDNKVINFEKQRLLSKKGLTLNKVSIETKKKLPLVGWYGYVLDIQANVPGRGIVSGRDMLFSNGIVIAPELISIKNGSSFKSLLEPKVTAIYYKKDHLIAGNANAKNKVVIFSDPLCPYCKITVPGMIKKAQANPDKIALYYYHFPLLSIHPASDAISKAMLVAKKEGVKNIELKVYAANFEKYFPVSEKNQQKILDGVNKALKTNITLKDISNVNLGKEIQSDVKMGDAVMVRGTPTIFVNGINDKNRTLFGAISK